MKHLIHLPVAGLLLLVGLPASVQSQEKKSGFDRWEKDIAAYEAQDRTNPPPQGGILFIGSSTIRRWTSLAADFPEHQVINRGFGGSQIADSTHFAERIIFPYAPRQVFLRAGGNDINAGKSAEQVFQDLKDFVAKVHSQLPATEIVFISQNPTLARLNNKDREQALNRMAKEHFAGRPT